MEPNQPNPFQQPPQQNPQLPNQDFALRSYFLQQGQSINKLNGILHSNSIIRGFKTFLSILIEILMYILFIFSLFIILFMPTALLSVSHEINSNLSVSVEMHPEGFDGVAFFVGVVKFLLSFAFLFCAILLRRNRKKSSVLSQAFLETEMMKKNFNQALQQFRF